MRILNILPISTQWIQAPGPENAGVKAPGTEGLSSIAKEE